MCLPRSLMVTAVILTSLLSALPFGAGIFTGRWAGEWRNSLGESGANSLVLREDREGTLKGLWTGEIEVSGNRINADSLEWRGRTTTRSCQITATLDRDHNEMHLKYFVTRLNAGGSYQAPRGSFGSGRKKYSSPIGTVLLRPPPGDFRGRPQAPRLRFLLKGCLSLD